MKLQCSKKHESINETKRKTERRNQMKNKNEESKRSEIIKRISDKTKKKWLNAESAGHFTVQLGNKSLERRKGENE